MSWKKDVAVLIFLGGECEWEITRTAAQYVTVSKRVTCIMGRHSGIVWRGWGMVGRGLFVRFASAGV